MEKRKINSESELVSALCKGVEVVVSTDSGYYPFELSLKTALSSYEQGVVFFYSEPVEVVELWGKGSNYKQTQIHQNGQIIWTETEGCNG